MFVIQDDDEISAQYQTLRKIKDRDTISQMSMDSTDSREPIFVAAIDIRRRLSESINGPKTRSGFKRDPEDPSASVLKEPWEEKGSNTLYNTVYPTQLTQVKWVKQYIFLLDTST